MSRQSYFFWHGSTSLEGSCWLQAWEGLFGRELTVVVRRWEALPSGGMAWVCGSPVQLAQLALCSHSAARPVGWLRRPGLDKAIDWRPDDLSNWMVGSDKFLTGHLEHKKHEIGWPLFPDCIAGRR